jgi:solute:Na+ symporter, SSS family
MMPNEGWIDAGIVLAFVAYCIVVGLRSRGVASENLEQYFLAGRTLPGWQAGVSMAATQFAADTPLLVTGLVATAGIFSLWRLWIYTVAFLLMGFVLGASWRRAGVLTDAELAELRYGGRSATGLRLLKAFYFGTVFNCTVLAMVLLAAMRIAEPFLRWQDWLPAWAFTPVVEVVRALQSSGGSEAAPQQAANVLSLLAIIGVTGFYSTTGGLRAVVKTDVVQFVVAMTATLAYAVAVTRAVGGLAAIPVRLQALYGTQRANEMLAFTPGAAPHTDVIVLAVIALQWLVQMNADGTGYLAQRTMACRSDRDARQAALVFAGLQTVLRSLCWLPIAVGLLILVPLGVDGHAVSVAARERTFVDGIAQYLPVGFRGLMLTGLLAALASTIDTHLNWGGSYWTNDLFRRGICQLWLRREPPPRALVWVARASNLGILAVALAILTRLDSIQSAWHASLLLGAGMGIPLVARWLWWRVSAAAELAAIVASSILAPLTLATIASEEARLLIVAALSTLTVMLISALGRTPPDDVRHFYERAQPPGWWGPVAAAAGDDPARPMQRLRVGVLLTGTFSLALFCLLVGVGSWMVGSPAPAWMPSRTVWIGALLAGGIAAALFGWRTLPRLEQALRPRSSA